MATWMKPLGVYAAPPQVQPAKAVRALRSASVVEEGQSVSAQRLWNQRR